jgi:hypothetical protein
MALMLPTLLLGSLSCTEERVSDQWGPLQVTYSVEGGTAYTDKVLTGVASIHHPSDVSVTFVDWSWTVDGVPSGVNNQNVMPVLTTKHEIWQVSARAEYGTGVTDPSFSREFEIQNSPPVLGSVIILPPPPPGVPFFQRCSDTDLSVSTSSSDADNDPVTLTYQWFVNSTPSLTTPVLPVAFFAVGDVVEVTVLPNDGEEDGASASSAPATIVLCPQPASASGGSTSTSSSGRITHVEPVSTVPLASAVGAVSVAAPVQGGRRIGINESNVCSIDADGSLRCNGQEEHGLTSPPEGAFSHVSIEIDYACAIRVDDGSVQCWGEPLVDAGQLSSPEGAFAHIDLAAESACGLRATGEITCWGDDSVGQSSPPEGQFLQLEVSDSYGCAMAADDELICWGLVE